MAWNTIFANLAAGNQPLSLIDQMFAQVANLVAVPCVATGANAISLAPTAAAPTITSYVNFQGFRFQAAATSTASVTLNFNGFGALPAYHFDGVTQCLAGDLTVNREYLAIYLSNPPSGTPGFVIEAVGLAGAGGSGGGVASAGQRICYSSGLPLSNSTITNAGTVFFTPYLHQWTPMNVGGNIVMVNVGGELSQALSDASKSPAAAVASSCYSYFVWNDANTLRFTRGPVWTSITSPGAGNALTNLQGCLVNTNAITNGPGALAGTYVGSIYTNSGALADWQWGSAASGGGAASLSIWNQYNRLHCRPFVEDTEVAYNYSGGAVRSAGGSNNNRITWMTGQVPTDGYSVNYRQSISQAANATGAIISAALNQTAAVTLEAAALIEAAYAGPLSCGYNAQSLVGQNFFQAVEGSDGTHVTTYNVFVTNENAVLWMDLMQ